MRRQVGRQLLASSRGVPTDLARAGAAGPLATALDAGAVGPLRNEPQSPAADGVMQIFWRRRWIILFFVAACVAGGYLYLRQAVPFYTSSAKVLIQRTSPYIFGDGV